MNEKIDLYLRIKTHIKRLIQAGAFLEGEALPSVRKIALDMGVNPNTVMKSYQALELEGLIEIIPKKGAFVKSFQSKKKAELSELDPIIFSLQEDFKDQDIINYIQSLLEGDSK
ncbi:MAG: GntR family transcriptional regulator [Acholeplasmataceae bacterium]|nr:GntR family transcriptional regulator [Acholeplasmataceae bacterium]